MTKESEIRVLESCVGGDAAAFEPIVQQYQSLVCAITYSAVGQVEKSEELAQQVFINAWKGLGTLKDLENFKAWLVGITRNVIRDWFRRQKRDIVAKAASIDAIGDTADGSAEPLDMIISKEQEAIVCQSLQQIPEKYREPMVLFYRQQQSSRQVAEALELSEETVRTRLMRGRKMLKEQVARMVESTLSHTGPGKAFTTMVVASIAGLALTGATASAATGTTTATGTSTAASSVGSSGLAALTTGITAKIITAAAVVAIGVGAVFAYKHLSKSEETATQSEKIAVVQDQQEPMTKPANTESTMSEAQESVIEKPIFQVATLSENTTEMEALATEPITALVQEGSSAKAEETFQCKGVVTNLDGFPISNAKVVLYHDFQHRGLGNRIVGEVRSDDKGTFNFKTSLIWTQKTSHSYSEDVYIIVAIHSDYAFAWQNIRQGQEQESYELILTDPISRTITVTDQDNNSIAGAWVWPYNVGNRKSGNPLFRDYLKLDTDIGLLSKLTDSNGQVTFTNLPETQCSFHATLEGYATGLAFSGGNTIRLNPGANVQGRVLAENSKPVEGAIVKFDAKWMHLPFLAKTDAEGYFFFKDLPAQGWDMSPWGWGKDRHGNGLYEVTVRHDQFSIPGEEVQLIPGENITDFIMDAYSDGTLIKCKVVAVDTNKPIAGVRIQGSSESGTINGYSDKNGVFSVQVEPGPVSLYFTSPPDGVYVLNEQNFPESHLRFEAVGKEMETILKAPAVAGSLINIFGYVFDPNNSGQSDAVVYVEAGQQFETSTAGNYIRAAGTDYDGLFELKEVPAGLNMHVYAETKDRSLAGTGIFKIPADPNEIPNIEVKLESTQDCKIIIDKDGEPVRNTSLQIRPVVENKNVWGGYNRIVKTDDNGFLRVDGILPGLEYYLRDIRFESNTLTGDEWKWFKGRVTLIPHEPVLKK